ncbi:MAG TPA: trigger factor, partial [Flavobacterium sp.]|nr:trigger factor [Flavobacterium sp.]
MNITRKDIDSLNAVITIEVSKADYEKKVEKLLANKRKNTSQPGFRKGTVPMSIIRKQFGKAILLEEINKMLQENLNQYLQQERLDMLGNPIPVMTEDFNWDADDYSFDFQIGLTPQFDINLNVVKDVTHYKITADDKMLDEQVDRIRKQYGKMISKDTVEAGDDISGTFSNEEKAINAPAKITLDIFKDKATGDKFLGKKVGDVVTVNTKGLFDDDHQLMDYLKVSHDDVHGLDIDVDFTIEEITMSEPAELTQELFDKLFGEGAVNSVEEIKARIKEDA